jgi:hypothetical protein
VDQSADHGCSHDGVAEDFAPSSERLVGGDDDGGSFVAGGDELEEQVGGVGFEGDVSDFVDYEQGDPSQAGELCLETTG